MLGLCCGMLNEEVRTMQGLLSSTVPEWSATRTVWFNRCHSQHASPYNKQLKGELTTFVPHILGYLVTKGSYPYAGKLDMPKLCTSSTNSTEGMRLHNCTRIRPNLHYWQSGEYAKHSLPSTFGTRLLLGTLLIKPANPA